MKFSEYLTEIAKDKKDLKMETIRLFESGKKIIDKDVHALADELGVEHDELENTIYSIMSAFFSNGMYMKSGKDAKFDKKELVKGIKVEMEHTGDKYIAERIAKDHLTEIPGTGNNDGYYSLLERMEAEAEL